jgi:DNA-binding PadR family transcriptional regulator
MHGYGHGDRSAEPGRMPRCGKARVQWMREWERQHPHPEPAGHWRLGEDRGSGFDGGGDEMLGGRRRGMGWHHGASHRHGQGSERHRPFEQGDLRWLALDLIAEQPRHGYEVIKAIEDSLNGNYAPSPGAVYPMLTMLEETGLIVSEAQGPKKLYRLTEEGGAEMRRNARAIEAARARLAEARNRFGAAPAPELHRAMNNLRAALQVRLAKGELSAEALATITGALDRAASEVERS